MLKLCNFLAQVGIDRTFWIEANGIEPMVILLNHPALVER